MMDSVKSLEALAAQFAEAPEPHAAIDEALNSALANFVTGLEHFEPARLIEVARMAYLPWTAPGHVTVSVGATAAHVELLALIALAVHSQRTDGRGHSQVEAQAMSTFVSTAADQLATLLKLAQLRAVAGSDPGDKLLMIALRLRASQVFVRNSSYAELVQTTIVELLDGDQVVRAALLAELGFDATDALAVLTGVHDVQLANMNARGQAFADAMNKLGPAAERVPAHGRREAFQDAAEKMFEPDAVTATVSLDDVALKSGVAEDRVRAVCERFRLDLGAATPAEVVESFVSGNNPMRTHPLIWTREGQLLLPHDALTVDAVRENLEEHLKGSSAWDAYAKHRGLVLEGRTRAALERVLPGAIYRDAFEYYVPASDTQDAAGDPQRYSKRVEGDHLVVLDDVVLIVEDKAVALSALSRGGKAQRIRTDLSGIITKAAEQANRLRSLIERDGGVRIEDEGWVDLTQVREIHTVAVSLEDLMGVTTATAELVRAGFLDHGGIPWTVSLHDLDLITQLVSQPAQFLHYLRRRRNPNATVQFIAADELDLFLYFFKNGLWVEPDPEGLRDVFRWMPAPTNAERRRFRRQAPVLITSQTDALDAWYHASRTPGAPAIPKPAMAVAPLQDLVDDLRRRGEFGWLSIGATLLECSTTLQHKIVRQRNQLLGAPTGHGDCRSWAMPLIGDADPSASWLTLWATRSVDGDPANEEQASRDYLRTKKHQLGIPRGVAFLYDEGTRDLVGAFYDGHIGELAADLSEKLKSLRPATAFRGPLHPNASRPTARHPA